MVTTKKSFTKQRPQNDMELFKDYWKVKQQIGIPIAKWEVLRKCDTYNKKRQCFLCLNEKY